MTPHPKYEDLMTEALFDEISPEDRRRLHDHLDACEACREEFESLQSTVEVMAELERDELPPTYWISFRRQVLQTVNRDPSVAERVRQWWQSLPVLLPQTGGQWAMQGAVAVLFVAIGLWMGQDSTAPVLPTDSGALATASEPSFPTNALLDQKPVSVNGGQLRPRLRGIEDISFSRSDGRVDVRYSTVNEVHVSGAPDDPTIRRLLQAALLDTNTPSAQLHAVQTLERADISPSDDLVQALTVLIRTEDNVALQVRAVRALRRMHRDTPLDSSVQSLLVGLVLDNQPEALRVEALRTLMETSGSGNDSAYLYAVRDDSNDYLRYQAQSTLQTAARLRPPGVDTP